MSYEEKLIRTVIKLIIAGVVLTFLVLWGVQLYLNRIPAQPIYFKHRHHVTEMHISCFYCHTDVAKGSFAGMPSVQDCMQCHQIVNSTDPNLTGKYALNPRELANVAKLISYWKNHKPIHWVKVYKLPQFVHYTHRVHVEFFLQAASKDPKLAALEKKYPASYPCVLCHGNVAEMKVLVPKQGFFWRDLVYGGQTPLITMGHCINCHTEWAGKKFPGGPDVPSLSQMRNCSECHY
jgi:hypothetical protein